ncbi:MAG: ComEC/Rec2 family competence protein [Hyphomicrobiales bacterium]|nr:ComEC/Rec2 family competence protein [Hyphomicrobiales bacterium]
MKNPFGSRRARVYAEAIAAARPSSWGVNWREPLILFSNSLTLAMTREVDARRPFLFLAPSAFCGVLLYFAADDEPSILAPLIGLIPILILIAYALRRPTRELLFFSLVLATILSGFALATWRTLRVDAPIVSKTTIAIMTGAVQTIDIKADGARLLIKPLSFEGYDDALPDFIRVTMSGVPQFEAGAKLKASVRVLPPPGPVRPGGYDFARDAYFNKIGGVGSLLGKPVILTKNESFSVRFDAVAMIDRFRNHLAMRIANAIGGQAGAVSAALITGKRGLISEETNEDLRLAGIYHVVSISGLHMVLVAGMIFFLVRLFLVLIPGLALRVNVKIWAALAAMCGAIAYDIFAGSEVATERSLFMTLALFGAILVGRPALSMRNLVIAAFIIIAMEPESLLGPSFQMSFAAVAALIAAYERLPHQAYQQQIKDINIKASKISNGLFDRFSSFILRHVKAILLTTFLAELATAPFALYHFQRFQPLGVIGNMFTIPLVEMVAMPAGFIGLLALPFGLDGPVWHFMGYGVSLMLALSHYVAEMPFASVAVPALSVTTLLFVSAGIIWIFLWSTSLRWLGLFPMLIAGVLALATDHPDFYIARDGASVAARGKDGYLHVMGRGVNEFTITQWLAADGDVRSAQDVSVKQGPLCSSSGCVMSGPAHEKVVLGLERDDLEEDCKVASVLITPFYAPRDCDQALVIDRDVVNHYGAVALYRYADAQPTDKTSEKFKLLGARDPNKNRPWIPHAEVLPNSPPPQESVQRAPPDAEAEPLSPR